MCGNPCLRAARISKSGERVCGTSAYFPVTCPELSVVSADCRLCEVTDLILEDQGRSL
jgi:hypothetical protein